MGPTVVHAHNVLDPSRSQVFRGEEGRSLRELRPQVNLPMLCILNGDYVLPEDEDWVPNESDHVVFATLPKGGGNTSNYIIGIVMIAAGLFTDNYQLVAYGAAFLAATALIPTVPVAPIPTDAQGQTPSPTYTLQVSGNEARLGQSIPVPYGRHIIVPDFAAQPYSEFDGNDDQYYHAILCIGMVGKFTLESIMIDDTELSHFQDVQTEWIGPEFVGPPGLVDAGVVTAPEVVSNDMTYGEYIGPFAVCRPGLLAKHIGIDIICPKGLWHAEDDGHFTNKTASWLVEARPINGAGLAVGGWTILGYESITDHTNKPIRRSYKYNVTPGRYEVRVQRQEAEDENARSGHQLQWAGLRAYLDIIAPGEPNATYLALKMRATSQLSGLSQRKVALIIRRWLPVWNPLTGWGSEAETRSIAWAAADILRNPVYGRGLPDKRIDLQSLWELEQVWQSRGDSFNGVFDKKMTAWAALQTVLRCGRARPIMRGSIVTFIRDEPQTLPAAMFTMRHIERKSFKLNFKMVDDDAPDGVEVQFYNEETWETDYARVPLPGLAESVDPTQYTITGITNKPQALREAAKMAADEMWRRDMVSFTSEMGGYLRTFGDYVGVSHDVLSVGASGDIESWDGTVAVCSEPLNWSIGDNYAMLQTEQGDLSGPYLVTAGPKKNSMLFLEVPPAGVIYTGTERERTVYTMGAAASILVYCKMLSLKPTGDGRVQIVGVVEDDRVHTYENSISGTVGGGSSGGSGGGSGTGGRVGKYTATGLGNYGSTSDAEHANNGYYANDSGAIGGDGGYTYAP